jgi:hypothetical protein
MTSKRLLLCIMLISACGGLAITGCTRTRRTEAEPLPPPRPLGTPLTAEERRLRELALDVQIAPDPRGEADAIKQFQSYLRDNRMTYKINAYRVSEDRIVASPTVASYPVRAVVDVFRGQERLHTFVFIPKDNQNLALLIA